MIQPIIFTIIVINFFYIVLKIYLLKRKDRLGEIKFYTSQKDFQENVLPFGKYTPLGFLFVWAYGRAYGVYKKNTQNICINLEKIDNDLDYFKNYEEIFNHEDAVLSVLEHEMIHKAIRSENAIKNSTRTNNNYSKSRLTVAKDNLYAFLPGNTWSEENAIEAITQKRYGQRNIRPIVYLLKSKFSF